MFEVGFTEIVMILGIALVVLGPEKLPKVAREVGRWLGRARSMARQLKSQLDEEVLKEDRWARPTPGRSRTGSNQPRGPSSAEAHPAGGETATTDDGPAAGQPAAATTAAPEPAGENPPADGDEAATAEPTPAAAPAGTDKPTH